MHFFSNFLIGADDKPLKLTIVTEVPHCKAIEEAFSAIFCGRMEFKWLIPVHNSIPALPVGHLAGVQTAELKIHCARQHVGDIPMISTSTLIYEAIPKRYINGFLLLLTFEQYGQKAREITSRLLVSPQLIDLGVFD